MHRLGSFLVPLAIASAAVAGPAAAADRTKASVEQLIADLRSDDGATRVAATVEIFRRGKPILPDLKKAGAKQVAPVGGTIDGTRRLDIVYSVLEGFPPNPPGALAGYRLDSFGIHFQPGTTQADAAALAKSVGCQLGARFAADQRPNCYFRVGEGRSLADAIGQVLANEPKVVTINLNYFER